MSTNSNTDPRRMSASEVKNWVGKRSEARFTLEQYEDIAARLSRYRSHQEFISACAAEIETKSKDDQDRWWDFKKAIDAVNTLIVSSPKMLNHWKSLQHWPETKDGYRTIETLKNSLLASKPLVEFPFGPSERSRGRKAPKDWHHLATAIARLLIDELVKGGDSNPSITQNSVLVRVVQKVIIRKGYAPPTLSINAIAIYLGRWDRRYGLLPKTIRALNTKQAAHAL